MKLSISAEKRAYSQGLTSAAAAAAAATAATATADHLARDFCELHAQAMPLELLNGH